MAAQVGRGRAMRTTMARPAAAGARGAAGAARAGNVAVLGAAGGIGQPLSMLLAMNPQVQDLRLYDIRGAEGVAADLSHCNTDVAVRGFSGDEHLGTVLSGADLVIIPAGVPQKPGMTRDDLFAINAGIVRDLTAACAKHCPGALINVISNPVNSTVPIAAEVLKKAGVYDKKKLFGVSTLDVVRSNKFVAEKVGAPTEDVDVPVVGGHSGTTIVPLFSQKVPSDSLGSAEEVAALSVRVQNAGTEVVEAKAGAGSATLSMAYAAGRFAESCLRGLAGDAAVECAYVDSDVVPGCEFFATKIEIGPEGVMKIYPVGDITPYEQDLLDAAIPDIQANIKKGVEFANQA